MKEYIVDTFGIVQDFADLHGDMSTPLYQAIMDVMLSRQHEEIVRCRDCNHFREERRDSSIGWVDEFVCVSEQWSTSSLMPNHKVEPDGFCKWAERREDGDAE